METIAKWHFAMLNDKKRNKAIENAILDLNLNNKIVFEIGTGSGLFSILFAKSGASHVYTCEENPLMASIASKLVKNSDYANLISLYPESSSTLIRKKKFNIKPDIIFTETVDCGIIGEGFEQIKKDIIQIANDNTEILPNNINKLGVLINSNSIVNLNKVDSYSHIDISYLNQYSTSTYFPVRSEMYKSEWLSESTLIRKYDYTSIELPKHLFSITATKDGICHGILSWFEIEFGKQSITTKPNSGSHWHQAFHPLEKTITINNGKTYNFVINNKGRIEQK
jgi:type II protein arginine methyltransferase